MIKIIADKNTVELHIHNAQEINIKLSEQTLTSSSNTEQAIDRPNERLTLSRVGAVLIVFLQKLLGM